MLKKFSSELNTLSGKLDTAESQINSQNYQIRMELFFTGFRMGSVVFESLQSQMKSLIFGIQKGVNGLIRNNQESEEESKQNVRA